MKLLLYIFVPEVWGTVSDWCMTIATIVTAYYLYKTLVVDIYDLTGKFVTHIDNIKKNAENISFDVTDWNAGLYFINIKTDKETLVRKFVKN